VNFRSLGLLAYEFVALSQSRHVVTEPGGVHCCTPIICFQLLMVTNLLAN